MGERLYDFEFEIAELAGISCANMGYMPSGYGIHASLLLQVCAQVMEQGYQCVRGTAEGSSCLVLRGFNYARTMPAFSTPLTSMMVKARSVGETCLAAAQSHSIQHDLRQVHKLISSCVRPAVARSRKASTSTALEDDETLLPGKLICREACNISHVSSCGGLVLQLRLSRASDMCEHKLESRRVNFL